MPKGSTWNFTRRSASSATHTVEPSARLPARWCRQLQLSSCPDSLDDSDPGYWCLRLQSMGSQRRTTSWEQDNLVRTSFVARVVMTADEFRALALALPEAH